MYVWQVLYQTVSQAHLPIYNEVGGGHCQASDYTVRIRDSLERHNFCLCPFSDGYGMSSR